MEWTVSVSSSFEVFRDGMQEKYIAGVDRREENLGLWVRIDRRISKIKVRMERGYLSETQRPSSGDTKKTNGSIHA